MTKITAQVAALALSALMTLGIVAGMNAVATRQYAAADSLAMAQYGQAHVAVQHVVVIGRRTNA
jgi:ABC-type amino acid transport system permease subunit